MSSEATKSSGSLHTRLRPKTLDEVMGHSATVKSLKNVIADGRSHAFIFTGPAGCGKTTLGRILANQFSNGKGTQANIIEIDAASTSGVDAVREVASKVQYRAIGGSPVKTIILDEAHRLSAAAWAALLKPIEEPPAHVYWVLCTTEAGKIPKTIQTRCLKYDLKPVNESDLLKLLKKACQTEKLDVDLEILEAIVEAAAGSPRQALVYLEACLYSTSANEARQVMRSAGQSREAIDLCRFIMNPRGGWAEALKIIKGLEGLEAESTRIVVINYLGSALLNTQDENKAKKLLYLIECFSEEYRQSERVTPLLKSVALTMGMDQ